MQRDDLLLGTPELNIGSDLLRHPFSPLRLAAFRCLLVHPAPLLLNGADAIILGLRDENETIRIVAGQLVIRLALAGSAKAERQKQRAAKVVIGRGTPHMKSVFKAWGTLLLDEEPARYVAAQARALADTEIRDRFAGNLAAMVGRSYKWPDIEKVTAVCRFLQAMGKEGRAGGAFLILGLARLVHAEYRRAVGDAVLATGHNRELTCELLARELKSKDGLSPLSAAHILNLFGRKDLTAQSAFAERDLRSECGPRGLSPDYLEMLLAIDKVHPFETTAGVH